MDVRFISEKDNGIYAYVEYTDGKKYEVDYTYLKNVASVKKAINVEYERMDCHIVITECDGLYETTICEKTFVNGRRKNWKNIKPAEADSQPAEADSQPAEADSQPAEADSQPVENQPVENQPVENQPVENQPVENQPVENQPADYYKKYVCILSEIQNQDNEYFRKYKLFDVSKEVNNDNIKKFADNYIKGLTGEAYIIEKTGTFYWIVSQKKYKIKGQTKWITKDKNSTCKAFVDLFRKNS